MLNVLFPRVCNGCKSELLKSDICLCTRCLHELPLACHHRTADPAMKDIFYGRIPIFQATSLLKFQKKGLVQEVLHNLKYRGQQQIGDFLGQWLGAELSEIESYRNVDAVVPVPLHRSRLKKRGYNQVSKFAKSLSVALDAEYLPEVLTKKGKIATQVFKQRAIRFDHDQTFALDKGEKIRNKHVLLVDDIVTTGATLEKCGQELLNAQVSQLSLATMAIA